MKYLSGYTDPFLSPVSGLLATGQPLPDLERGYVWVGDKTNRPTPSFKLIDLTIDVRSLQQQVETISEAPVVVNTPVSIFPNAQALSDLNDGIMKNMGGLIQIALPNTDYLTPMLASGNIWIGNNNNIATPQPTIALSNLPNLGTASITIPNPIDPINPITISGGKIWHGTDSNRPEESTALLSVEADIALLNARFLLGEFIMGDALVQATWPKSQFLINLQDGMLKKTGKTLQYATPGTDYLDLVNEAYADGIIPVVLRDKVITRSKLQIINIDADHDNLSGINTLTCRDVLATVQAGAGGSVRADQQLLSLNTVEGRQLILYDYNPAHRYTQYVSLKAPASVAMNINWVMPDMISTTGQVLTDIGNVPLSTDRQLAFRNMPSVDATYILKQPNDSLPNAQALNQLIGADPKMLKAAADGTIEVAVPDEDYATKATLEQLKEEAQQAAQEAATSAEEAATSAGEAATSAGEATTAAGEATVAAGEASASALAASGSATAALGSAGAAALSAIAAGSSASSASSSASDASHSASNASSSASQAQTSATNAAGSATQAQTYLNTLLNTGLTLQGDVTGNGLLNTPIVTKFTPNPVFTGNGITIPAGSASGRPSSPAVGFLRLNASN